METFKSNNADIGSMHVEILKAEDHIDEETFLKEFFGNFGRDLGSPKQFYNDNPCYLVEYVNSNNNNKLPSFVSTQPRKSFHTILGIEKVALDFDYYDKRFKNKIDPDDKAKAILIGLEIPIDDGLIEEAKKWKLRVKKKATDEDKAAIRKQIMDNRKIALEHEVALFVDWLVNIRKYTPMVVKTRKGFHVYIYLDMVYNVGTNKDLIKETYRCLTNSILDDYQNDTQRKIEYVDDNVKKDVFRIMRVPTSIHEATGEKIGLVKVKISRKTNPDGSSVETYEFVPDKCRHLSFYQNYSLKQKDIKVAFEKAKFNLAERAKKLAACAEANKKAQAEGKVYNYGIRPCFIRSLKSGEMPNLMRLAFEMDAYYNHKTVEEILELLSTLSDFDYDKSKYYVQNFLDRDDKDEFRPWSCDAIRRYNWCIDNGSCPIWCKRYKNKDGGN